MSNVISIGEKEYGICDIHRKTYEPVIQYIKHDEQITIDEILKDPQNIK